MVFCRTIIFASLCFAIFATSAQSEPVALEPSSNWNVDYGADQCTLLRIFGPEENSHAVYFRQWAPATSFAFTAAGPEFSKFKSLRVTDVRFRAGVMPRQTEPFVGESSGFGAAIIYTQLSIDENGPAPDQGTNQGDEPVTKFPQLDIDRARMVEFVELTQGKNTVTLNTGDLREAFTVMNSCMESLLKDWGLDVERHLSATRLPTMTNLPAIARKVSQNYPRAALIRGEQAILQVRVMIDETGKATDCMINEVTRTQQLDSPACRPLMMGKYTPALDKNGQPFASYFTTSIVYRMN